MRKNIMTLKQLDTQLLKVKNHSSIHPLTQGWTRTLRKALGMTIKQLADRLHVTPSRIVKIEQDELEGRVTLNTLQNVAESMDCILVYHFVPKSSLQKTIEQQANKVAHRNTQRVAHTMHLEDQQTEQQWLHEQTQHLAEDLLQKPWKHLWNDHD